ncbi:MAG: hypothetical protein PCFJNLEI_00698 [Verrucomicrobiae bacterium]|nr:hypothetical protein [Verrucomicrobiae bacterium]
MTPYTVTYDGLPHSATVTSITGVNGETGATVGTVALNTTHTAAGTYSSDSWSFTSTGNYNNISVTTITNTINKATPTVTVTGATTFTDNSTPQGPITYSTSPTGDTGAATWTYVGVSGTTYGPSSTRPSLPGSYTATVSLDADGNFNAASSSATAFTINNASSLATVVFTTPGSTNWTAPANVTSITVETWGGGGGGRNVTFAVGGGGGGGAYARVNSFTVTPGNIYSLIVGAGGGGNAAGGNSSFNSSTCVAAGGAAGSTSAGGAGGTTSASTGDVKFAGGSGSVGQAFGYGGGGGGGSAGTNSVGTSASGTATGAAAVEGGGPGGNGNAFGDGSAPTSGPGGGGGGAASFGSANGGAGYAGQVRITYKLGATVTLSNLTQTYDGNAHTPTATTTPAGLTINWNITPTNAGSYSVIGTINDSIYQGSANGNFVIQKATPTVSVWPTASGITYGQVLSASTLSGGSASVAGSFTFTTPSTTPVAGTYSAAVTFTPNDTANYTTVAGTVSVAVAKATPVITWNNPADISYGTPLSSTQLNATSGGVAGSFVYTPASGTVLNAGDGQTLSVQFTPSDTANYNTPAVKTVTINVGKVTPTVSPWPTASGITFGQALSASTLSGGSASVAGGFAFTPDTTIPGAGTYSAPVTFTPSDTANYTTVAGTVNVTVAKATPVLVVGNSPVTYNGSPRTATVNSSVPGTVSNIKYAGSSTAPTAAGTYAITADFAPTDSANYNSLTGGAAGNFVIQKATPTLSVANSPVVYTGSAQAATVNGSVAGTASNVKYNGSATVPTAVGTYAVTADFVPTDSANYISLTGAAAGNFVIQAATPTLSVGNSPATYNGSAQAAVVNGSVPGTVSNVKYDGSATVPTAAGTYAVTADFVPTDNISYTSLTAASAGNFVIQKATPTLSVANSPVTFTGSAQTATVNGSVAGTVSNVKYNGSATAPTAAGTYAVTADFVPTDSANYNSLTGAAAGNFAINLTSLVITALPQSKTYGTAIALGTTAFTTSGLLPGDSVTSVTLSSNGGTAATDAAGSYTITPSAAVGTGLSNYTITYATGTLTVNPLAIQVTGSRTYNGTATAAAGILTVDNKVSGDTLTLSGSATLASKAIGSRSITSFSGLTLGGASAGNYTLSGASGALSIGTRLLTVTATGQNKLYDGNTTATVTLADDRASGDSLTLGYASATFDDATIGSGKTITVTGITVGGPDAGNYTFNATTTTTADISGAPVVITHPASQLVTAGTPVSFNAVVTASPSATVQWEVSANGGSSYTPLPGATVIPLVVTVTTADNGKKFRAVFSNASGTTSSNPADLTVPANNISSQVTVTRGGARMILPSRRYVQTVTIKNTSSAAITGPVSLALDSLSSNASLYNKAGITSATAPAGKPYVTVNPTGGILSPNATVSVTLEFVNPTGTAITYSTRALGQGAR